MSLKLKDLKICENILVSDNKLSLINIFSEVSSPAFPALHPKMSILITTGGEIGIYNEKIEIVGPDDKIIASSEGPVEIKAKGSDNNFIANFINVGFLTDGKFWIKVSVDGVVVTNKNDHFLLVKKLSS